MNGFQLRSPCDVWYPDAMNTTPALTIEPPAPVATWIGDAATGYLQLLDQTKLPTEITYLDCKDALSVWEAIQRLSVRGAPAIGVAAAYGMVVASQYLPDGPGFLTGIEGAAEYLSSSRPTAVNLGWACQRMVDRAQRVVANTTDQYREALLEEARDIHAEDVSMCMAIGHHAAPLVAEAGSVLTHCNAGALATSGIGTATAGMYVAHAQGHSVQVYCDETRPLLQGSRLTAWELQKAGIDATVITDNMSAVVMREKKVSLVLVGSDRIAANGDAANKIGTYGVAILARYHGIPFYVAAPYSTFDMSLPEGGLIPIEERASEEITRGFGNQTAPDGIATYSPAFDVTPAELITGIITERGIISPVNTETVAQQMNSRV